MKELLKDIRDNNIVLEIVDGELKVFAGTAEFDRSVISRIKERKSELVQFLLANKQGAAQDSAWLHIPVAATAAAYPLSSSQKRIWILSQFKEGNIAYNIPGVYVFEGGLDAALLEAAFNKLIARHEILRTVFREDADGEIMQFIQPADAAFKLAYRDLRGQDDQQLKALVQQEINKPFDLAAGPLLRAGLYQVSGQRWIFTYTIHHIISDAWSMNVLIKELLQLYNTDAGAALTPLRIQYKDYAVWQQSQLREGALKDQRNYWLQQFEGEIPVLQLPGDKPRPVIKTFNGGIVEKRLPAAVSNKLKALAQSQGGTLFMGLLAAVKALLYRYTGQTDLIIGSSVLGRDNFELESQIGFYLNILAMRTRFNGTDTFRELFNNIKKVTLGAYEHQLYPFDELLDELHLQRDTGRSALFDVIVGLQNMNSMPTGTQQLGNVKVSAYEEQEHQYNKFDFTFLFAEVGDEIHASIGYNSDIYNRSTVERLGGHLEQLLAAVVSNPEIPLNQVDYLSKAEKQQLSITFAESKVPYPADKTVVQLFNEQAARTPDNIALAFEGQELSYRQLQEQSDRLAYYLRSSYQVKADDVIGIMLDRSASMIVALLGVLKSGAAYVAIEPDTPRARKEYILNDTAVKALITQSDYVFDIDYYRGNAFAIDIQLDSITINEPLQEAQVQPGDLAYVIYTSGSTGQPKGVMINHRSLVDYAFGALARTNIADCKSFGLVSTIAADLGNTVIYTSLLIGAKLHVFSAKDVMSGERMQSVQLDCIKIVPSHWKALQLDNHLFAPAKCLVFGGEQLTRDVLDLIKAGNATCEVYNHYGPSETTIGKLINRINLEDTSLPIALGSPFCNSNVYILDAQLQLLPTGLVGEICIGGHGQARGYLNNPALTAERFVADPFKPGQQIYKTGDLGKWLPNGAIEFLGRKDDQVKIRGYRIELGEIENALKNHPDIETAAVLVKPNAGGEKELVAYVVGGNAPGKAELQKYLGQTLPSYMVPGHFIQLETMPLTPNGKVDRKKLPDPDGDQNSAGYVAPRNATEEKLVAIWQDVLGRERVGVKDNFFELGGHSLKATRLASQIHKLFDVKVDFNDLFTLVVLEEQARLIDEGKHTEFVTIPAAAPQPAYPLSSSQRRLWILSQFEGGSTAYNVPAVYVFEGSLNYNALMLAFEMLIARHEILRTIFKEDEQGEVKQFIRSVMDAGFKIDSLDMQDDADREEKVKALVQETISRPFNLSERPLVRADLYRLANDKWIFVFNMHHIISDGWSQDVLMKELLQFYKAHTKGTANPLDPLRIQYKDYAVWQQEQLHSEAFNEHRTWWLQQFEGSLPVLELPLDKPRPAMKTYKGGAINKTLNPQISRQLQAINQEQGATLFMGLLAAVNVLLYRYTGQDDIITGTPVAGREHADLENQVGFYVNTLALRAQFNGAGSFEQLLQHIKQVTTGAYKHQAYPFDKLVDELQLQRDLSRHPLFDVMVIMQHGDERSAAVNTLEQVQVSRYEGLAEDMSKFDLSFGFAETAAGINIGIGYNSDIYNSATIDSLGNHLVQLISAIVAAPQMPIQKLDYLAADEAQELLETLNDTTVAYPKDKTLVHLFEAQVKATPDHKAVVLGNINLTYRELNEKANQLAAYLREQYHIQPNDLTGILLDRNEWMIISILGILKAGGAYVPIDPEYPQERIEFMITDSNCKVVINEAELEQFRKTASAYSKEDLAPVNVPSDLAYVIYTSGTTGKPKGSLITHNNVVRLFKTDRPLFDFTEADVWTVFHSFCFDFSVWEMYGALLFGGKLVLIPSMIAKDPAAYLQVLIREGVTVLNQTPSAFYNLAEQALAEAADQLRLRYVIFGGEALSPGKLAAWKQRYPATRLINMYGITETTVHVTYKEITDVEISANISNIGKPIPTLQCYILDAQQQLMPKGVWGEMYVGGEGVCNGYLNRAELTSQRFIASPFKPGERLYRSGDKVRMLANGEMEYGGRMDDQVKIRGYRIELGEIESLLQQHPQVDTAVVLAKQYQQTEKELVAYIVAKEELNVSAIRAHLGSRLPAYMLPAHYVQLTALPLTHNGKIDRKKLPDPQSVQMGSGVAYVAPRNEMEKTFAAIYEQVLNKQPVGISDDFFNLGGDSIKILRTISALRKQLSLDISIADFYRHSTIESLVQYISGRSSESSKAENNSKAAVLAEIAALKDRVLSKLSDAEQVEDIFPMSDIEKGMVYESLVNKDLGIYHDVLVNHRVLPGFDMDRFRRALALLIDKHALLRTAFLLGDDDGDLQIVYKTINVPLNEHDLTSLAREAQEQKIRSFLEEDATNPFNVTAAPLWRADVFRISSDEIVLALQFHHAVLDGWSHANLLTELNNVYLDLEHSSIDKLPLLRSSYKDFVIQQQADKRNRTLHTFWEQELAGYKRPDLFTSEYEYNSHLQTLDYAYQDKLQALAATLNTSIKTISLSAYLYLLKVLSADNEVVAGLVTNTRPGLEDSDKVLGCFLNTVPLRFTIREDITAAGWVKQVEEKLLALKEPERVSLIEIARLHPDAGQGGGNPFFDSFFNFVNFHVYEGLKGNNDAAGTEAAAAAFNNNTRARTNMPLEVNVNLTGNVFNARFFLSRKLRSGLTVADLGKMYFRILQHIADAPEQLLREAAYIDAAEEKLLLHTFNDTATDFPADKTMIHLFEEQVSRRPEKAALVFGGRTFTYRELNEQANRLAAHLRATAGIQPNDLVGIQLERSEWMIISILGVLKSGAAYIPIDPAYPQDRIDYMVADSQSKVLINDAWLAVFNEQQEYSAANLPIVNQPTDLAYVIYTSGSTGRPKGCMLEHRGVVNRVEWMYRQYAFSDEDVILQKTTFTFDVSVWEIFMPLCWGVKMVLCHKDDIASPQRILQLIATQGVTCLHFVPSMLSAFITALFEETSTKTALQGLRLLITSGEALPVETVKKWYSLVNTPIHNLYGPTEASVDVTFYATTPQDNRIPIGRPIWNTQLYILGRSMELLPMGVAGEICIGGVGLSRGYLNKGELTAQKFVENPFRKNERLYRTGDLGQWLPDGNILYLGRIDDQVKIRGYRIELGEIESVLLQSGLVSQVAAIAKADAAGNKRLLAFVVPAAGYSLPQLQQYLTSQVPDYMHPAAIIELSALPLTPNGKADKKALAALQHSLLPATEYVAPRNETEQKIAAVWEEVLAAERIGMNDNFFTIGGDSIISIRLLSRLKKELHREIELRTFYEGPTVAALAAHLAATGDLPDAGTQLQQEITAQLETVKQEVLQKAPNAAAIADVYPMSDIQKGMVFEQLKDPENGTYHDQFVYQLPLFDLNIFKQAFTLLVEKHSILRTGFDVYNIGSDSLQIVYKTVPVNMLVEDLTHKDAAAQQGYIRQYIIDERKRPFDLSVAPLWRISIFVTAADQMVYLFQFHHAILDGWSVASLNTELHHLCLQLQQDVAYRPAPLMADNKISIISSLVEKAQEENIRFWQQELADHKRLSIFENKALAASFEKSYPPDYLPKLENAAKLQGVPVRTLFLGAYLYTLQLLTAETDLTIGLVSNVRPVCEDGDKILGCFLNTIPLRYQQGSTAGSWRQYTMELDHKLRSLKGRDRLSLYEINRLSGGDIRESNPFFDVIFNYINFHVYDALHIVPDEKAAKGKNSLELKSFESTNTWLDLSVSITGGMLKLIYKQKKELIGGISLAAFNEYFERALENIAFNPTGRTDKQVMLSAQDLQQLLGTFNNTTVPYPANETIQEQFERQAAATPQQIAIVTADAQLTYRELNEKANQLAAFLRGCCQVTAETLVALVSGRSAELVVGMLGILKSGAAYVPIDPELPAERVRYMLEDARVKIVITENEQRKAVLPAAGFEAVVIKDNPLLLQYPAVNLPLINNAANLAYVIYTSGSTGRPKGVMLEHAALSNLCNWHNRYFEVTAQSKATVYSSISFDAAGWEIWPYLLTGAALYPLPGNIRLDVTAIAAFIKEQGITHCFLPTVICEQLADAATTGLDQVKILTGGDALRYTGNLKLTNNYGPTENAVVSASIHLNELNDLSVIPIGKPIDNTAVYILDVNLQLQPVGVTGEICLAGHNLARGYLHQPALTAEKFVANPFKPGERLYRTGDLGRWLPDGNIAFAGRKDEQVKIRGYRIELGEIESILQQQPGIQAAVVLARPNSNGQKELVAYLVSEATLNITVLRAALGTILPAYMLPAHFVQLDVLPLNASGKVDKKNLPDPETGIMAANGTYVPPRNEAERNLVAVYEEVLKKQPIGIKDDFLALGGDSIKSIQVVARLKQRGFTLTIQDVIRFPVIEELAGKVQVVTRAVPQGPVEGLVPLGPIQSQFLNGPVLHKHHYNQSVLLYSKTPVDVNALHAALDKIVQHHDALRMVFRQTETGWLQENKGKTQGYIFEEIRNISEADFAAHCDRLQSGMQLEDGPLFSVGLFRGEAGDRLLLVAHHLVIDGVSWRILFEDLSTLYQQYMAAQPLELPLKTDSFQYWQQMQQQYAQSETLQKEAVYWDALEAMHIPPVPVEHAGGSSLIKDAARQSFLLNESLTSRLLTQCYSAYRTEVNDLLLGAFSMAVAEVFELEKVLINLEGHGRENIGANVDVTRTVGWFTSMYPVVFDMRHREDAIRQLITVKETLHRVPNKGMGYGILRYTANRNYRLQPQIAFNYLGDFGAGVQDAEGKQLFGFSGDYQGRAISPDEPRAVLLDVLGMVAEGRLRLTISYSTQQYSKPVIARLLACFQAQLEELINTLSATAATHLTPVDLTYKELSMEQVQQLDVDGNTEDVYPLSHLQEGLYYHWLSTPGSLAYCEQMSYRLKGTLNLDALERSYEMLVARHAVLRTSFTQELDSSVLQVVKKKVPNNFQYLDVSGQADPVIEDVKRNIRQQGFDLHSGSQMNLTVLGLGADTYEFIWGHHHILMDGWCVGILIKEFSELYEGLLQDRKTSLPEVQPYAGYISWLMQQDKERSLQYWRHYLADYDTVSTLPQLAAGNHAAFEPAERAFNLGTAATAAIKALCAQLRITENTFIQTIWGLLLSRYNNTRDVVFGAVVSGRPGEIKGIEEMIGLFINTIPVRIRINEGATAEALLKAVQESAISAAAHHYTQLADVLAVSEPGGGLIDHILIFENYPVQEMVEQHAAGRQQQQELLVISSAGVEQTSYNLSVSVIPDNNFRIRFEYNSMVYAAQLMATLEEHFTQLVIQVLDNPALQIDTLCYLSEAEKQQQLIAFNEPGIMAYPKDKTVIELLQEQVSRTPENIAIIFKDRTLTYQQLHEQSNRLAHYLKAQYNIQPNDLVGIKLERSEWVMITVLAVLKSGGAYVPVDPDYPQERIDYLVEDSKCKVLIDEDLLEAFRKAAEQYPAVNLDSTPQPDDLAYIIYTSGSTGNPKGVMIGHQSLVNLALGIIRQYSVTEKDRILQFASLSFDMSVEETFPFLLAGAGVVVRQDVELQPSSFRRFAVDNKITILNIPPLFFPVIHELEESEKAELFASVRMIAFGGEALPDSVLRAAQGYGIQLFNAYGPTESTVNAVIADSTHSVSSVIGKPFANTQLYVLDAALQLLPIGVSGELYIAGDGLAKGYLHRPELTAEKFIDNPFGKGKLYRTGDVVRWTADGNIVFIGRQDDQVKIRGYRIELGEIETALQLHEQVNSAVVVARSGTDGEKMLVAYVIGNVELNVAELRTHLNKTLPAYMIPSQFVQLDSFPVTANGKVNKKQLPDPQGTGMATGVEYLAPRNETEEALVRMWQEILKVEKIGIKDDFFELGGHSLKVARLAGQIHKAFDYRIALKDIFFNPTIEALGDMIRAAKWIESSRQIKQENRDVIEL